MDYSREFVDMQNEARQFIRSKKLIIPTDTAREAIEDYVAAIIQQAYLRGQIDALK